MKIRLRETLLKQTFLFAFVISLVFLFLSFHSDAEEKADYEIQAALDELVRRAVRLTEDTVDVQKHVRNWPRPEFRNKWSKRTYEMQNIRVRVRKTEDQSHPYRGTVFGTSRIRTQGPFDSKESALSAYSMTQNPTFTRAAFKLTYLFESDKWALEEGQLAPFDAGTGRQGSWKPIWSPYHGGTSDRRWGIIYKYWAPK
ncbi:MAG: hypothetical protein PVI20_07685 [Desulfobacteraceae bacterium]|jgi:hypothetical protein